MIVSGLDRKQPYVLVGHVADGLKTETVGALMVSGIPFATVQLATDESYFNLIAEAWAAGETFITVEQDIVPDPGDLHELLACSEPWCAFAYEYPPFGLYAGMGCARFAWTLLHLAPDAMQVTGTWSDPKHAAKHWCRVDAWLKYYLVSLGFQQHVHGQVKHLHRGRPAHDCVTPDDLAAIAREQQGPY